MELLLDLEELLEVAIGTCEAPKNKKSEAWDIDRKKTKGQWDGTLIKKSSTINNNWITNIISP